MKTVIEYREFIEKADKLFGTEEREKIVSFLSSNPKAGKKNRKFRRHQKNGMERRLRAFYLFSSGNEPSSFSNYLSLPQARETGFRQNNRNINSS